MKKRKMYAWYLPHINEIKELNGSSTAYVVKFIISGDVDFFESFVYLGEI